MLRCQAKIDQDVSESLHFFFFVIYTTLLSIDPTGSANTVDLILRTVLSRLRRFYRSS